MKHIRNPLLRAFYRALPSWYQFTKPRGDLKFPFFMSLKGPASGWMPAMWYQPAWPRMRAFALPAFADGHIRINLAGRESKGIVLPEEYQEECDRVAAFLKRLRNPRSGNPIVKNVWCTRNDPLDNDPLLPLPDLVVQWNDETFDVVDSPDVGRIGPVPYFRTGGHRAGGFALLKGPGIAPGTTLPRAEVFDLAPTILNLLGAKIPSHFEGKSFLPS